MLVAVLFHKDVAVDQLQARTNNHIRQSDGVPHQILLALELLVEIFERLLKLLIPNLFGLLIVYSVAKSGIDDGGDLGRKLGLGEEGVLVNLTKLILVLSQERVILFEVRDCKLASGREHRLL